MTRETKVGLVVASSFLCLVGAVVAARMSRSTEPEKKVAGPIIAEAHPSVTEDKAKKDEAAGVASKKKKKSVSEVVPAALPPQGEGPPPFPNLDPEPALAPELKPISTPKEDKDKIADLLKENKKRAEKEKEKVGQIGTGLPTVPELGGPPPLASGPTEGPMPPPIPTDPTPGKKPESEVAKPPAVDVPPPPGGNNLVPSPPVNQVPTNPAAKPTDPPVNLAMNKDRQDLSARPNPVVPPPRVLPGKPGPDNPLSPPGSPVTPPSNSSLAAQTPPAVPVRAPAGAVPPLGSKPEVSSPPIAVGPGAANSFPQVNIIDMKPYVIRPEDRSFADISKNVYGDDRYGQALMEFNRELPGASNPLQVRPGTTLQVPSKEVLESKYVRNPAAPITTGAPPVTVGTPTPLSATPGNPTTMAGPPPGTGVAANNWAGDGNKTYRVRDGGEPIYQIARNILGDGNKWPLILNLNQSIRPEYPIPGGTVLRLPAEAITP